MTAPTLGLLPPGFGAMRAAYERDVDRALARGASETRIVDADLAHLPDPVQRYLKLTGVVGQRRVHNFRARMHGRLRNGRDARWMSLAAEQYNFFDPPARLCYLRGSLFMIPVQAYHRYVGPSATMTIKAAGFIPLVDASGDEMNHGETVTMFNDMCLMAPATLIDRTIAWEPVDAHHTRATFTNAGQTIRAELSFNDAGELINFASDDRYQTSPDGKSAQRVRWSTPFSGYRNFGIARLASGGEARWHEHDGDYAYIALTIDEVRYNLRSRQERVRGRDVVTRGRYRDGAQAAM